jgi:hypothetical protein
MAGETPRAGTTPTGAQPGATGRATGQNSSPRPVPATAAVVLSIIAAVFALPAPFLTGDLWATHQAMSRGEGVGDGGYGTVFYFFLGTLPTLAVGIAGLVSSLVTRARRRRIGGSTAPAWWGIVLSGSALAAVLGFVAAMLAWA